MNEIKLAVVTITLLLNGCIYPAASLDRESLTTHCESITGEYFNEGSVISETYPIYGKTKRPLLSILFEELEHSAPTVRLTVFPTSNADSTHAKEAALQIRSGGAGNDREGVCEDGVIKVRVLSGRAEGFLGKIESNLEIWVEKSGALRVDKVSSMQGVAFLFIPYIQTDVYRYRFKRTAPEFETGRYGVRKLGSEKTGVRENFQAAIIAD